MPSDYNLTPPNECFAQVYSSQNKQNIPAENTCNSAWKIIVLFFSIILGGFTNNVGVFGPSSSWLVGNDGEKQD